MARKEDQPVQLELNLRQSSATLQPREKKEEELKKDVSTKTYRPPKKSLLPSWLRRDKKQTNVDHTSGKYD